MNISRGIVSSLAFGIRYSKTKTNTYHWNEYGWFFHKNRLWSGRGCRMMTTLSDVEVEPECRPTLRGVVFDMDGTLTVPNLNFQKMYQQCGVDPSKDKLWEVEHNMSQEDAAKANSIIKEMEEEARRTMRLMAGAEELGQWLYHHNIPASIVTRNTQSTLTAFLDQVWTSALQFDPPGIPRDYSKSEISPKPDPAALYEIVQNHWSLSLPTKDILMIGDSPTHDVAFGQAAGVSTALLDTNSEQTEPAADVTVQYLYQLPRWIWNTFDLEDPLGTHPTVPLKYDKPQPQSVASQAAYAGDLSTLQTLSPHELQIIDQDNQNTPLIWAVEGGHVNVVDYLLTTCSDQEYVNHGGYVGNTAVCRAAVHNHVDMLQLLIQNGKANMNQCNSKMQYPLHFAAFQNHLLSVELLLQHNANTMVCDRKGRTPDQDTQNIPIQTAIQQTRQQQLQQTHL